MRTHQALFDEAMRGLRDVDFTNIIQLNVSMDELREGIAERLAEHAMNLPWEEWADDGPEEVTP